MIQKTCFTIAVATFFLTFSITCQKKNSGKASDNTPIQQQLQNIMEKTAQPAEETVEKTAAADIEHIKSIGSLDELKTIVDNTPGKLLVFDLYADWCMPCKLLAPMYDSIAKAQIGNATFYRVDVQRQQEIAAAFNVQSIPFVVFIKDKEMVHSIAGLNPREQYEKVIANCGSSVPAKECIAKLKDVL